MWLHSMFDLSLIITPLGVTCFIIIHPRFIFYSSFSLHLLFFAYGDPSRVWYSLRITITHLIIILICFICLLSDIIFTLDTLGSLAHGILYTCCISHTRAWVLIIGYLSLVSFHFYHPSLRYVPCLETTLRPWDQTSSSIASAWIGVWDLVDV